MTAENHLSEAATNTRPKIYRLPEEPQSSVKLYISRTLVILCLAAVVVVVLPELLKNSTADKPNTNAMAQLETDESLKTNAPHSVKINENANEIVGQMAQLPRDPEQKIEVKTNVKIDNETGKELLKIISQY